MTETRHELSNYRNIIEISDQIKRPEVKNDSKDRMPEAAISRKSGSNKAPIGASFAKDFKPSNSGNTRDIKDVEYFKCHKKGHYANKYPDANSMGRAISRTDSSKLHPWTKMKKNQFDRSESDFRT